MVGQTLVTGLMICLGTATFAAAQPTIDRPGLSVLDELGIELPPLTRGGKPGVGQPTAPGGITVGDDSCRWAHDMECDDIRFGGTGACAEGTDASDCRALAFGGDNSCQWAFDNECDEPHIGLGVCTSGTDTADCASAAHLRNRSNSCATAFNDICEEAGQGGNGQCAERTDTVDCFGRETVPGMRDHYFGRDERVMVDSMSFPWRAIGRLDFEGGACTATLVAPDVVLTAAHCFLSGGRPDRPIAFFAGLDGDSFVDVAGIADYYVNPRYDHDAGLGPGQGNGEDWGFARLDRPLGDTLGHLAVLAPQPDDQRRAVSGRWFNLSQGGYSWDTGGRLSAHLGCHIIDFLADNSVIHECDTTYGDSGSPLFVDRGNGDYAVMGVASRRFNRMDQGQSDYLAVDARAFAEPLINYIAGRLGNAGSVGLKSGD